MNKLILNTSRVLMVLFALLSLSNSSTLGKVLFLALAGIMGLGGQWLYKKLRSKEEEKVDTAIELESKKKILSGIDTVSNLKPIVETQLANKLQNLLSKSNINSSADKIRELDGLRKEGLITEEEFSIAKKNILGV